MKQTTSERGWGRRDMDANRFDRLARSLSAANTRRGLLRLVVGSSLLAGLATVLGTADESDAKGRRQRRKKRHKHAEGKHKEQRKGQRNGMDKGKDKGKDTKGCRPEPTSKTCGRRCGAVQNNCRKDVDCGSCACDPPCEACETCTGDRACAACAVCCNDVCCTGANAICHADTGDCCVPDSHAKTCKDRCGDVVNTCGHNEDCGSCLCARECPACQTCDGETGACVDDPDQHGDDCGGPGQVCQHGGNCACATGPDSCPACTTCGGDGTCHGCTGCCDGQTCVENCGAGRVCCGDGCVSGNCCTDGACGAHAHCQSHTCQCDAGFHDCQGTCVNDQSTEHCGTACSPCPSSLCSPATCDGQRCGRDPIAGCCASASDCDDGDVCSTDTCDPGSHTCIHTNAPSTTDCGSGGSCCGGSCCTAPAHASPTCDSDNCGFTCNAGFHRCGGQCVSDGDVATCGGACAPCPTTSHGQATCDGTNCGIDCDGGYDFCGGDCLQRGGDANCTGGCDACGLHMHCQAGGCVCDAGFANCDGNPGTGCEANLDSNGSCGACGTQCGTGQQCVNGSCACDPSTCAGCCQGASCIPFSAQDALICGRNGETCDACSPCSPECFNGVCTNGGFTCACDGSGGCNGHGCCTPNCTCVCDPPWTGSDCSVLPPVSCSDFTTCTDCQAHLSTDLCTWCAQTLDGARNVCVQSPMCFIPIEECP